MSKSNVFEQALLDLIFLNTPITLLGDAAGLLGSAVGGSLYVSFHTADPGEAGDQSTSETGYTAYARVAVARNAGGWTRTGSSVSPTSNIDAPECTASPGAALTNFGIGTSASGAGKLLYKGPLTPNITMAAGVIPRLKNTSTVTEE